MRATYLQRREPFDEILVATLTAGWRAQYGDGIVVDLPEAGRGRRWLLQPWMNGYYVPDAGPRVRAFLRDNFRHTQVRGRAVAQWLVGTVLAHPVGLRLTGQPAFVVNRRLPAEDHLLVVPGSQRIRVFDFSRGCSRVMLKQGFAAVPMRREIEVRGGLDGPFPRLSAWSEEGSWFEEPILDALPLARLPSRAAFARFERRAMDVLETWLERSRHEVAVEDRLSVLNASLERDVDRLSGRLEMGWCERVRRWAALLTDAARPLGRVPVADAHGDLMRDNIMVDRSTERVYIIDWERCRSRYFWYDRLVYSLDSRLPAGLGRRLQAFAAGSEAHWAWRDLPGDRAWRRAALALFLLEDLSANLHVNASSPLYSVAEDFSVYLSELAAMGDALEYLFEPPGDRARRAAPVAREVRTLEKGH